MLTAHEGSAAFAADVTGRMTGVPGLCIATLGPGATNLTTGVGSAWLDRSPLIAITCTLDEAQLGRRLQMWIDHHALFKPITKATLRLRARRNRPRRWRRRCSIALSEPQGPVHLDLPEDVALAPAARPSRCPRMARRSACLAPRRMPSIARAGRFAARGQAAAGRDRRGRHAHAGPAGAARVRRAAQHAVRDDDDGQGHDRRGPSRCRSAASSAPCASCSAR